MPMRPTYRTANRALAPTVSVLVDGRELSGEGTWSGVGTTIRGLLGGLSEARGLSIRALTTPAVPLPGGIDRATIHRLSTSGRRRSVMEHQLALPLDLARYRTDVFHNPHPHPPLRVGRPWVQTLYDVIPLVIDDPNMDGLRRRWERFAPRYRRADLVVAISRHAANEGIRHLGLDHRRVEVVHLGVDASFHPAERAEADDEVPSVLVVSEYSRRKGYADAFAVIAALADGGVPPPTAGGRAHPSPSGTGARAAPPPVGSTRPHRSARLRPRHRGPVPSG